MNKEPACTASSECSFTGEHAVNRALCKICHRPMPLRRDGTIRVHGPVSERCPGSGVARFLVTSLLPKLLNKLSPSVHRGPLHTATCEDLEEASTCLTSPIGKEAGHHPRRGDSCQQFQQLDAPLKVPQALSPCPY